MRIVAGLIVIGFLIVGARCSDPDVVPESHISTPPENRLLSSPRPSNNSRSTLHYLVISTCTRVGLLTLTLVKTGLGLMRRIDLLKAKR